MCLTSDQWAAVLKLSTIWGFHSVRTTAIEKLADFASNDPVLKVILAKKYDVSQWFVPAMEQLAQRDEPLTFADAMRFEELGSSEFVLDFSLKIAAVRESAAGSRPKNGGSSMSSYYCGAHGVHHCGQCTTYNITGGTSRASFDFANRICEVFSCNRDGSPKSDASDIGACRPASSVTKKKKKAAMAPF